MFPWCSRTFSGPLVLLKNQIESEREQNAFVIRRKKSSSKKDKIRPKLKGGFKKIQHVTKGTQRLVKFSSGLWEPSAKTHPCMFSSLHTEKNVRKLKSICNDGLKRFGGLEFKICRNRFTFKLTCKCLELSRLSVVISTVISLPQKQDTNWVIIKTIWC